MFWTSCRLSVLTWTHLRCWTKFPSCSSVCQCCPSFSAWSSWTVKLWTVQSSHQSPWRKSGILPHASKESLILCHFHLRGQMCSCSYAGQPGSVKYSNKDGDKFDILENKSWTLNTNFIREWIWHFGKIHFHLKTNWHLRVSAAATEELGFSA